MPQTSYQTEDIVVRAETLNSAKYANGTYKKGQLLGRVTAYASGGSDGSQIVAAVCPKDLTISASLPTGPVARGEFSRKGVKAVLESLNPAVSLNDQLVGQCWDAGIILN
jgi:hypothetical protein